MNGSYSGHTRGTCKNLMSLQAALPASHCTVAVQTASVTLQKKVTKRSAVARCVIRRLMVDLRRRMRYMRIRVATLPLNATTNIADRTIVFTSDSWLNCGTSLSPSVSLPNALPLHRYDVDEVFNSSGSDPDGPWTYPSPRRGVQQQRQ